jgi:hypothetical protein
MHDALLGPAATIKAFVVLDVTAGARRPPAARWIQAARRGDCDERGGRTGRHRGCCEGKHTREGSQANGELHCGRSREPPEFCVGGVKRDAG